MNRGSFRKFVKRGQKLTVKKLGGITSLALTPRAVFKSSKGGKILARGGANVPLCPLPLNEALDEVVLVHSYFQFGTDGS